MPKDPRAYAKQQKNLGKQITTLVVGVDEHEYTVHQDLLCQSSPFFAAATKEEWKEGQEHRIPMIQDDPEAVALYVQWLYSRKIFSRPPSEEDDKHNIEIPLLVVSYVLGEKIQDDRFKDTVIDAIVATVAQEAKDGQRYYPSDPSVNLAYEGTPDGSPLRRLLVDMYFFHGTKKWIGDTHNVTFLADLTRELLSERGRGSHLDTTQSGNKTCIYHHHDSKSPCHLA